MRLQMFVCVGAPLHKRWSNQITRWNHSARSPPPAFFNVYLCRGGALDSRSFSTVVSSRCADGKWQSKSCAVLSQLNPIELATEASPPAHQGVFYPESGSTWSTSVEFPAVSDSWMSKSSGREALFFTVWSPKALTSGLLHAPWLISNAQ